MNIKRNSLMKLYKLCLAAGLAMSLGSCNSFLDEMPDNRQELNRPDKIQSLLTDAYANIHHMGMLEGRTDNIADNGSTYGSASVQQLEDYAWLDMSRDDWDSSKWYWDRNYTAIAHCNQALESISQLADPSSANAQKGEALVARAWAHFNLVNYFGMPYNAQTSERDLGVPYVTEPEKRIGVIYPRETVKRTFELIEKDLLEGMPLINDAVHTTEVSKYHFTTKAAYAFAAQFYLFYEKWQEAKEYADKAIGLDPSGSLRNIRKYSGLTTGAEVRNAYTATSEPANILIQNNNSGYGGRYVGWRFANNGKISRSQTFKSPGPWGALLNDFDIQVRQYTSYPELVNFIWKYEGAFQVTNKRTGVGYPYVIAMPLTVDKTLLVRAEANALLGNLDAAAADLSRYYVSKGGNAANKAGIVAFYTIPDDYMTLSDPEIEAYTAKLEGVCKPLNPKFTLAAGEQTAMVQAVLHARRIETMYEGDRWFDIRRYGLSIKHEREDGAPHVLASHDLRYAMQLPSSVIIAGLPANPR